MSIWCGLLVPISLTLNRSEGWILPFSIVGIPLEFLGWQEAQEVALNKGPRPSLLIVEDGASTHGFTNSDFPTFMYFIYDFSMFLLRGNP